MSAMGIQDFLRSTEKAIRKQPKLRKVNGYRKGTSKRVVCDVSNEMFEQIRADAKERGTSYAAEIRRLIAKGMGQ